MEMFLAFIIFGGLFAWSIFAITKSKKEAEANKQQHALYQSKVLNAQVSIPDPNMEAISFMLENRAQIIEDSYKLITTSNNLRTVVDRYKFLKGFVDSAISDLKPYEYNTNVRSSINHYSELKYALATKEGDLIKPAIKRAFDNVQVSAAQLKTDKGYEQRLKRFFDEAVELLPDYEAEILQFKSTIKFSCLPVKQEYSSLSKFKYKSSEEVAGLSSFIALDLETTGLDHVNDKIIQVSAIRINRETAEVQEFLSYVNPEIPIPPFITELTGIKNADVANAPTFESLANNLIDFIGDSVIFAHNASFDIKFLLSNLGTLGIRINNKVCCTVGMSKHFFPELMNYKLDTVAKHLGIEQVAHHTASEDAMVCAQIALKCFDIVINGGMQSADDGLSWVQQAETNVSWERRKLIQKNMECKSLSAFDTYYTGIMLVKEHRAEEGEVFIRKAIEKEPQNPLFYQWLSDALVKQNRLDDALDELHAYQQTDYYKSGRVDTCIGYMDMKRIDNAVLDIKAKKARGYIYRPRKKQSEGHL